MLVGTACDAAAAGRARQKALLQQIRLIDILERYGLLADRRRERLETDRSAVVKLDDAAQHPPISRIEPQLVHFEAQQRGIGDFFRDDTISAHLRIIAHALEQTIGDTRRAA